MNNSKFVIDSVPLALEENRVDKVRLRKREADLLQIVSALQEVQKSKGWSSLKTKLFDGRKEYLSNEILREAKKVPSDSHKLASLAGELKWAERYADLSKLEQEFKLELANIRLQLHGKTEETG